MADSLGSLVVSLSAETAKFTDALDKATYQMNRNMGAMVASTRQLEAALLKLDGVVGTFGVSLRGLFGIVAVGGMGKLVTSAIDAQAELGRLANRSGATVEELSGLRVAAHEGGVGLDEIGLAMNRMSKALFEGQDKSTKAALALEKIGLSAKDLVGLPTAQAFQTIAVALNGFNESTGKSAVEMEIFSKSGPKMGAALKAVAENGLVAAAVTTQMADAARESEAKFFKLADTFSSLQTAAANQLLPALNGILDAFSELQKTNEKSIGVWTILGETLRVVALGLVAIYIGARENVIALHALGQALNVDLTTGHAAADIRKIFDDSDVAIAKAEKSLYRFYETLAKGSPLLQALAGAEASGPTWMNNRSAMYKGDSYYGQGGGKKNITGGLGGSGSGDDPAKAMLARQIAELDAYIVQEKALLSERDDYLKAYYSQGYLSEHQFYELRMQDMQDALNVEVNTYQTEIEAIDQYIATLNKRKNADKLVEEELKQRAEIEGKIGKAQIEGRKAINLFSLESNAAAQAYEFSLHRINQELLILQGRTAEAAAQARDDATFFERRKAAASGNTGALAQIAESTRLLGIQGQLTEAATKYGFVIQQLGINQSLVDLQIQAGSVTELEGYVKRADAARAIIPLLNAQAEAYDAIAKASNNPQFLIQAQQIRLEIAKLAVDADALSKKFTDIFSGAVTTFLTDIVSGTKSVKQAFLDMAKSIEQSITQIAAKNISESLFGKGGQLGGVGDFFAKMFGDKGAGGASSTAALSSLTQASGAATLAIDANVKSYLAVSLAADQAAAALASVAGSSTGSALGGLGSIGSSIGGGGFDLGSIIPFASGTPYVPKDMLAFIHKGEAIIPAAQNNGKIGTSVHAPVTIVVQGAMTTKSATQAGREAGLAIHRALNRS